jgi:hypothetical protein
MNQKFIMEKGMIIITYRHAFVCKEITSIVKKFEPVSERMS